MTIENRCSGGRACSEVVDRLVAADQAQYVLGDREHAARLREIARKFAELHHHGSDSPPLREAS